MVRTAGCTGGTARPPRNPTTTYPQSGIVTNAITTMLARATALVRTSTGRMPQLPIHRLVSGPAIAWPMLVVARTSPAAP